VPLLFTEILPAVQFAATPLQFRPPDLTPPPPAARRAVMQTSTALLRMPVRAVVIPPARVPDRVTLIDETGLVQINGTGVTDGPVVPGWVGAGGGGAGIQPPAPPVEVRKPDPPKQAVARPSGPVQVGGDVKPPQVVQYVRPAYPPLARQARIQGTVRIEAILARDGSVTAMRVTAGHPLLVPAAVDAVKQWRYRPTLLNGQPVEVALAIDVNFTLSQ